MPKNLVVDALNLLSTFCPIDSTLDVNHLYAIMNYRIKIFKKILKKSEIIPYFVFDNGQVTDEAHDKWKMRRLDEVKNQKRNMPSGCDMIFWALLEENEFSDIADDILNEWDILYQGFIREGYSEEDAKTKADETLNTNLDEELDPETEEEEEDLDIIEIDDDLGCYLDSKQFFDIGDVKSTTFKTEKSFIKWIDTETTENLTRANSVRWYQHVLRRESIDAVKKALDF